MDKILPDLAFVLDRPGVQAAAAKAATNRLALKVLFFMSLLTVVGHFVDWQQ
jgi:hypothetical protein